MNGLCSRLTFPPPEEQSCSFIWSLIPNEAHVLQHKMHYFAHLHMGMFTVWGIWCTCHARFFPPHIIVDSGKYLMWHLWCLQIFILTPKCSHSVKLQHLVILVAATELTSCWHQADYTLHTYWNHSFSHFVYILLADLAESSKDLLSQLLSHFYPLEIKQTNHNRESGWHFSLLFFISMAQEGRCQMSVHNYYQAL